MNTSKPWQQHTRCSRARAAHCCIHTPAARTPCLAADPRPVQPVKLGAPSPCLFHAPHAQLPVRPRAPRARDARRAARPLPDPSRRPVPPRCSRRRSATPSAINGCRDARRPPATMPHPLHRLPAPINRPARSPRPPQAAQPRYSPSSSLNRALCSSTRERGAASISLSEPSLPEVSLG